MINNYIRLASPLDGSWFCRLCSNMTMRDYSTRSKETSGLKISNFKQEEAIRSSYIPKKVSFNTVLPENIEEPKLVEHYPAKEKLKHCDALFQFFQPKKYWGEDLVKSGYSGQAWTIEALRLKSSKDLHKLWYVLLVERNVLSTLDRECEECEKTTPHEDKMVKVEQSMENILRVIEERNQAYEELEHDRSRPKGAYAWNMFGFRHWKRFREHAVPWWENERFNLNKRTQYQDYVIPWMRLRLERRRQRLFAQRRHFEWRLQESAKKFPDVAIPPLPSEVDNPRNEAKFNLKEYMRKQKSILEARDKDE